MPVKPHRGQTLPPTPRRERVAQKRRTRKAIVDAAMALIASGKKPSVTDVAAAADVSRRTVFLYFPAFDQLLIDATVGALSEPRLQHTIADKSTDDDNPDARVERLVRALHHVTPEIERLGRALVRLTVDGQAGAPGEGMPRRGYRRIEWIESGLAPLRRRLDRAQWQRLVCALAMVVGWEALIAQRDVCGLDAAQGEELSVWAARALVRAALTETKPRRRARARQAPRARISRRPSL
jgi:AcrR family transcriptional regulator